ncbi:MAG: UDP-glucose 4-epimerase GalE [Gammaproteobacteria bacterium]|nr:UDP-glucose 4-epimerase GalE [Gammaproteobacteria bacterium]
MPPPKPVLITGGAGYVGRHAVRAFRDAGYPVVVLDNLSTGCREAVPGGTAFLQGDAGDSGLVARALAEHRVAAVVHCAASASVPDSMRDPLQYYRNNSVASTNLIRACIDGGVRRLVFTSTASVYGTPRIVPIPEDAPTCPINPYGRSKRITEWMLRDVAECHDFRYVALRCFNVAGAGPRDRAGRGGPGSGHLIEVACEVALGLRGHVTLFGTDYDTADGTCVRDYVHVSDLAEAHVAALRGLEAGDAGGVFNCGYGRGFSVREVLEAVQQESRARIDIRDGPRRAGDPPVLIAEASRIRQRLRWSPRFDDLGTIIRTVLASRAGRPSRVPGAGTS